jgi:hypothetical protein
MRRLAAVSFLGLAPRSASGFAFPRLCSPVAAGPQLQRVRARCNTPKRGAQGQGKTWPKAGVLVPGEWQEPQRWVSSTRNRLQLKESRKDYTE